MNLCTPQFVALILLLVLSMIIIGTCQIKDIGRGGSGESPIDKSNHEEERRLLIHGEGQEVEDEKCPPDMKASAIGASQQLIQDGGLTVEERHAIAQHEDHSVAGEETSK
jgi:hypothetical protein